MERAGNFLGIALKRMRDPNAVLAWLQAQWRSLLGETLAAHIWPMGCSRGVLRLAADSHEWKTHVEAMEQQVRDRINRAWHGALVLEVRIDLVSRERRLAYEVDNNHLPFLRKKATSRA